jgi:hypothetical protein
MREFVAFAIADTPRYVLLFQRQLPDFEPSAAAYEPAREALARTGELLGAAGIDAQADVDCVVAMVAGLVDAQLSNDPGGSRWIRHLDRLLDMYLDHLNDARPRKRP